MAPDESEFLRARGRSLEDEFFHREDQKLLQRLRDAKAAQAARETLAKAAGITNTEKLDKLTELGIRAETVAALSIVPLVEVAWADGALDAKERQVILSAARKSGFATGSVEHGMLEAWLDRRPEPGLLTAWIHLIEGMCEQLNPDEIERLRSELLERARAVARASGGLFGVGSKLSSAEAAMLTKLESAFVRSA